MKKLIAMLLSLSMVFALAACGNGDASKTPSTPSTPSTSTPATPSTSTPAAPAEPDKITIGIKASVQVGSYEDNDFTRWLEENANVDLEFVTFDSDGYKTQLATQIAGGEELPDILYDLTFSADEIQMYGGDGYFIDLTDLFASDLAADWRARADYLFGEENYWKNILYDWTSADGSIYGLGYVFPSGTEMPRMCTINQTWLDKLGLEKPTNWDELVNVLRAFKTGDPNGNGKADEIPMIGGMWTGQSNMVHWVINNWQYFLYDQYGFCVEDGELYYPYITDEYRKGLQAMYDLVDEGLTTEVAWTLKSSSELRALTIPGDGVPICGVIVAHPAVAYAGENTELVYQYTELAPFNYAPEKSKRSETIYVHITENAENPEACFRMLMKMATLEGYQAGKIGVEGRDWEYTYDDKGNVTGYVKLDTAENLGEGTKVTWYQTPHSTLMNSAVEPHTLVSLPENVEDYTIANYRTALTRWHGAAYLAQAAKNNPDEILDWNLKYNEEESKALGTIQTDLKTFVNTRQAEFCTGALDPYSDADWNQYLKDVESLGLSTWLKIAQPVYERDLAAQGK